MAIEIRMPALSPTMTDGTLSRWLVKEGDEVRSGDVIAEIETDKATMEVKPSQLQWRRAHLLQRLHLTRQRNLHKKAAYLQARLHAVLPRRIICLLQV